MGSKNRRRRKRDEDDQQSSDSSPTIGTPNTSGLPFLGRHAVTRNTTHPNQHLGHPNTSRHPPIRRIPKDNGISKTHTPPRSQHQDHFLLKSKRFKQYLLQALEQSHQKIQQWYPDEDSSNDGDDEMDWQPEKEHVVIIQPQEVPSYTWDQRPTNATGFQNARLGTSWAGPKAEVHMGRETNTCGRRGVPTQLSWAGFDAFGKKFWAQKADLRADERFDGTLDAD